MKTPFKSLAAFFALWALAFSHPVSAQETDDFTAWVAGLKVEALADGIDATLFDEIFTGMTPNQRVIELDGKQPEFTLTFETYSRQRLSPTRIKTGREMMITYQGELQAVAGQYGVQPRFIVAIWGLETNYGGFIGGHDVIQSLATLAWASPRDSRKRFFRKELLIALQILEEGHIAYAEMRGSWAGAMGQGQFMPSSFQEYARDFDGDGRYDIWTNTGDILASIAYYLQRTRWDNTLTWGRQVTLPENFTEFEEKIAQVNPKHGCRAENSHSRYLPLADWNALGVRRLNGDDLPDVDVSAALVRPGGESGGPAFLVYKNYKGILRYNCSNFYALVVGQLSDRLRQ